MIRNLFSLGLAISLVVVGVGAARAGPLSLFGRPEGAYTGSVQTFTDIELWRAAAAEVGTGIVHEINFETLPDGSPSYLNALITDEFNYTDQGVTFFSHNPMLHITGNPETGFSLSASLLGSGGPPNWIISELVNPASAIGVLFGDGANISIFNQSGALIAANLFLSGGIEPTFGGFISDAPIYSVVIDRGSNFQSIDSFHFTPVPEPTTMLLFGAGAYCLIRRRK